MSWTPEHYYYRRATNPNAFGIDLTDGPHTPTDRLTVTTTYHAVIGTILLHIVRVTAPTTAGRAGMTITVDTQEIMRIDLYNQAAVGANALVALAPELHLDAGTAVRIRTIDTSTGGTCAYIARFSLTSYHGL
jgi:hypothetical protein